MPVYFFAYHAYRSWGPGRGRGYVRRGEGFLPADPAMAEMYDEAAQSSPVLFDATIQRACIEAIVEACQHQRYRLHAAFTEPTHVHALVSWTIERGWLKVRSGIKQSMTRRLNELFAPAGVKKPWFSDAASRKRVHDKAHLDYVMTTYLKKHGGWKWREGAGFIE